MLMNGAREEALECVLYIHYSIQFKKDTNKAQVKALIDSGSEVNAIYLTFAKQLGLPIRPTDIGAQKIDSNTLDTYRMVVAAFSMIDKGNWVRFFEKIFLVANISLEIVLKMPFLTLSDANIDFVHWELWWKTYTTEETLPTTRRVELVKKKKFVAATLNAEYEIYIVYVASFNSISLIASLGSTPLDVHSSQKPQISSLIAEEALTKVPIKYSDFADVFSLDLASKLPEYTGINDQAIELVNGQQPPYRPIYSLKPIELETLKAYIKTNLANGFINHPSHPPMPLSYLTKIR